MAIVWDTIGGINFIRVDGAQSPIGYTFEESTRPAANGRAFTATGNRGALFELTSTVDVGSSGLADVAMAAYNALRGSLVAIGRQGSTTGTSYLVLDVQEVERYTTTTSRGGVGSGSVILIARWTLTYGLAV